MRALNLLEDHYWIVLILGMVFGFALPGCAGVLAGWLVPLLMIILFITFLHIDTAELRAQAGRPWLLVYILAVYLVGFPVLCYVLTPGLDLDLRLALFLLAAVPCGSSAPALTAVIRGNASLSLVLTVLSALLVPLTIPLLLRVFFSAQVSLNYGQLVTQLFVLVIVPLVVALVTRRFAPRVVAGTERYAGCFMMILIALIIMAVIGEQAEYILAHLGEMGVIIGILFLAVFLMQTGAYGMVFWLPRRERVTVSLTKMAMNNALGIVLAMSFFNSRVALILVLSELPWDILPCLYNGYRRQAVGSIPGDDAVH